MRKTILFRVDGGKVWGVSMGHLKRSLLLADALRERYHIVYLMKDYPDGVAFMQNHGYEVETIDLDDDSDETVIETCAKVNPDKVVFDLYACPYTGFFQYARERGISTIIFDILGKIVGVPDILINDSFVRAYTEYPHLEGRATRQLLGPRFFLIEQSLKAIQVRESVNEVMITMGGSDPAGLTEKILATLLDNRPEYSINVVLGPAYTGAETIEKFIGHNPSVSLYRNPDNFLEILARQDIVLCTAGRTLYECAYLGRPVVIVPSIDHEAGTSHEYANLTGCIDTGLWNDSDSPGIILRALDKTAGEYSFRQRMFNKSVNLIDGKAIDRILPIFEQIEQS